MGSVGRVFVAVGFSDDNRHALAAYLGEVLEPLPGRPVPPPNWHLTIRYMGDMADLAYDRFLNALDEVDKPAPFQVSLSGLGAFPKPTKATVLWLGIARGEDELMALGAAAEMAAVEVGLPGEDRPFQPHLTLTRIQPPRNVWPWLADVPEPPIRVEVARVGLYRSHLGGVTPAYELLDTIDL